MTKKKPSEPTLCATCGHSKRDHLPEPHPLPEVWGFKKEFFPKAAWDLLNKFTVGCAVDERTFNDAYLLSYQKKYPWLRFDEHENYGDLKRALEHVTGAPVPSILYARIEKGILDAMKDRFTRWGDFKCGKGADMLRGYGDNEDEPEDPEDLNDRMTELVEAHAKNRTEYFSQCGCQEYVPGTERDYGEEDED